MIKKLCTLLLLTCITAAPSLAQRYSSSDDASFAPKKGQWQVSVLLGSGKFFNENTSYLLPKFTNTEGVVGLPNGGTDNSGDLNRYLNIGSLNNNSLVNIAGIEGKYFHPSGARNPSCGDCRIPPFPPDKIGRAHV